MLDDMKKTIAAAKVVASWSEETKAQILELAAAFKAEKPAPVQVAVKKRGRKPKAAVQAVAADPNRVKRKYVRKVAVAQPEAVVAAPTGGNGLEMI